MVANRKPGGRAVSMPVGLLWGALASLSITLLIALILARLVDSERISWESVGYGIVVLLLAASFTGAMTAYHRIKRQRLAVCMISGGIYFVMMLAVTALFFGGQYEAVGVTAALILAGCGAAGLIGLRDGGPQKRRKQLKRNR